MELKPKEVNLVLIVPFSLNRTFYGIETGLIITILFPLIGLNRTFYGIETGLVP